MPTVSLASFCKDGGNQGTSARGRESALTSETRFSNFGEGECGEPFAPHHLQLDFTPETEEDTAFVQQKIIDFWELVNSTPEIQHLLVIPENRNSFTTARTEAMITTPPEPKQSKPKVVKMEKTAISSLDLFSKPGAMTVTSSLHTSLSRASKENNPDLLSSGEPMSTTATKADRPQKNTTKAKKLCKILKKWDDNHPKSMEPPGHPPRFDHCVIQRSS
ncbi:uncharacterized protein LOC118264572 [Spodoptera frugiperda]|uniref:Uncharacterized protein LOC118264572 n=1 Tax=Spodoptera frugiperda TaxID=7108 RepID=A0A9R0E9D6_SPOFR|nr:uncharacterized protein LOC118264572 [Spodoptera frugiperda]